MAKRQLRRDFMETNILEIKPEQIAGAEQNIDKLKKNLNQHPLVSTPALSSAEDKNLVEPENNSAEINDLPDVFSILSQPPQPRPSKILVEERRRQRLESMIGTTTIEDVREAYFKAHSIKDGAEAWGYLSDVINRLPEDLRAMAPDVFLPGARIKYLGKTPTTDELLNDPAWPFLLGEKAKPLGKLERTIFRSPIGGFFLGGWEGYDGADFGLDIFSEFGNLTKPEVQQRLNRRKLEQVERQEFIQRVGGGIFTKFFFNAGETIGNMARIITTPDVLGGTLAGGGVGLVIGGPLGGVALGGGGGSTGFSIASGRSIAGRTTLDIFDNQPEGMQDEMLAIRYGLLAGVAGALLERFGIKILLKGLPPSLKQKIGQGVSQASSGMVRRMNRFVPSDSAKAAAIRFGGHNLSHSTQEALIEAIQSGSEVVTQILAANDYNLLYSDLGYTSKVPTKDDVLEASLEAGEKAFWGGSAVGMAKPALGTVKEVQMIRENNARMKNLSPNQREALAGYAAGVTEKNLAITIIEQADSDLRQMVKEATGILQGNPELIQNAEIVAEILNQGGESHGYINAEALQTLLQSSLDDKQVAAGNFDQNAFLAKLGVTPEQYREALVNNTDLRLDLTGMPYVVESPVWGRIAEKLTAEPVSILAELRADLDKMSPPSLTVDKADVTPQAMADLENSLITAGRKKNQAKGEATIWARMAGNLARITGAKADAVVNSVIFVNSAAANKEGVSKSLNQPYNADLDLNRRVQVVSAQAKNFDKKIYELTKGQGRIDLRKSIVGTYKNLDQGWNIVLNRVGADHAISSALQSSEAKIHLIAVASLPELIKEAILVETHPDRKNQKGLKQVHRFLAPLEVTDSIFAVKLTVKEYENGGHEVNVEKITKLYDLKIEKEMSGGIRLGHTSKKTSKLEPGSAPNISDISISQLIKDVNDSEGQVYLQKQGENSFRARTDFLGDGVTRIVFSDKADASSAIHEFQHVFIQQAQQILSMPLDQIADADLRNQLEVDFRTLEEWAGVKDGQWTVEAHEKVAQGFEQYFMEGRPPVKGLRRIFGQMKKWLLNIYKSAAELGQPITDDVRRVFDRQLATMEELAVESWRGDLMFTREDLSGTVDEASWNDYEKAHQKAREAAAEEIVNFRNAEHARLIKQWQKEGRIEAKKDPRQKRLDEIKNNGGISRESLIAAGYDAATIKTLQQLRPGLVKTKGHIGIDELATRYNLEYADALVQELLNTPNLKELTDSYVRQQEALFAEYFDSDSVITEAELDLWQEERNLWAKFMGEKPERKYQSRSWRDIKNIIAQKTGLKPVDEIAAQNMADLRASLKAQAKAAKEGLKEGIEEGQAKGYKRGAVEGYYSGRNEARAQALEKRLELAAKLKAAAETKREIEKGVANWRQLANRKIAPLNTTGGILPGYHSQIKNILAPLGIGREVTAEMSLNNFLNKLENDNVAHAVPDWIRNGQWPVWENGRRAGQKKTFRSLSYEEFSEVNNAVNNLVFLGRRMKQVRLDNRLISEDQAASDLMASITKHNEITPTKSQGEKLQEAHTDKSLSAKALEGISGYISSLIKTETMTRRLDGGEYDGLAQKLIYKPINNAYEKATRLTEELVQGKLSKIINDTVGVEALKKWRSEKIPVPGINWLLSTEQRMAYVLNCGNEQNMRALRNYKIGDNGNVLTDAQHQALIDSLTKEQTQLVQAIWDYLDNEMYPHLNDLTLRTMGIPLKKVEAQPLFTRYGVLRGGYYPQQFDKSMSERGQHLRENKQDLLDAATLYSKPNTRASATRERTGRNYQDLVPKLSLDVLPRSLNENIHDLTHREAVNDVWRMLNRNEVREGISSALGENYWVQMKRWLQEVARPESVGDRGAGQFLRTIRNNISVASMGMKMSVVACQVTGITQSTQKLGLRWTLAGLKEYYGNPFSLRETTDFIYGKSTALRTRNGTSYDRDIHDLLSTKNPLVKSVKDKWTEAAFKPIALMDQAVANPVWLGAYLKARKEGKSEADSIYYADALLRTTQPTGVIKDMSRAQRGWGLGDAGKLLTMFSTFFNGTQNLIWEQFHETRTDFKQGNYAQGTYKAGRAAIYLAVIPAVLESLVKDGAPEDEDDLLDMARGVLSYAVGGMPIVKDAVSYLSGDSIAFRPAPIVEGLQAVLKAPGGIRDIAEGETAKGANRILRGLGPLTGVPSGQLGTTIKGLEDWDDNEGFEAVYRLFIRESPK